ncbi:uncharacterized protein LOC100841052 [Brachypodium distachyon]|uniref:Uncharacterized protein n=1 Tax=Brachypodium distachyon TaxID=15368 RepID=I1I711_BRADI|nr:uncharacterized protein LOC100841052 [Brachypodium distachyon]KQJ98266.1 hypothetical protein BRADI_3g35800v3 [Brachypodium distachyon]|eukprot:XP_003574480.1 uncharacterized protein LOC100841052 [Brachypodium distachyon]
MAMSLARFSHWIWPGNRTRRARELPAGSTAASHGLFPDSPSGFREPNAVRLPSSGCGGPRPRKGRNRRPSREDSMIDREHDMVIVPSDGGGYLSDSDSDNSDWSIGWLEPQAPEMQSDGDSEGSFAVLVPCYRHGRVEQPVQPNSRIPAHRVLPDDSLTGGNTFVEQWLSSLQN